jgi:antitoxin CptB
VAHPPPLDAEGRQLVWRCRRGLKELDVLLERYAAAVLPGAGPGERLTLARLLERPDPELAGYLLAGEVPADAGLAALVSRIRQPQ